MQCSSRALSVYIQNVIFVVPAWRGRNNKVPARGDKNIEKKRRSRRRSSSGSYRSRINAIPSSCRFSTAAIRYLALFHLARFSTSLSLYIGIYIHTQSRALGSRAVPEYTKARAERVYIARGRKRKEGSVIYFAARRYIHIHTPTHTYTQCIRAFFSPSLFLAVCVCVCANVCSQRATLRVCQEYTLLLIANEYARSPPRERDIRKVRAATPHLAFF